MSNNYGPRIVTDGLVLCLDAADRNSYPGSGTTWSDLSGNGNNGSLINGPIFNSANGGSFSFDGTNDRVNSNGFSSQTNPSFSIFSWIFLDTTSGIRGVWGHDGLSDNNCHFEVRESFWRVRVGGINNSSIIAANTNTWQNVGFVCSGNSVSFFIDGIFLSSWGGSAGAIFGTNNQTIGNSYLVSSRPWDGKISNFQIYNRVLKSDEITQNYNATKGRFGL